MADLTNVRTNFADDVGDEVVAANMNALGNAVVEYDVATKRAASVSDRALQFPAVIPNSVITETEMANNWSGTSTVDTALYKYGDGSFRSTAPSGTDAFGARAQLAAVEDWSNCSLLATIRCDNWAAITDGYVLAWSAAASSTFQIYPALNPLRDDEWYDVPISISAFSGTVDWTVVSDLFFQWFSSDGQQPNVWVNRVAVVRRPQRGVVSLTFDDGYSTVETIARPYMDNYGMRGGTAVMPTFVNTTGYLSVAQMNQLANAGWDIQGHGEFSLDTLSESAMIAEIRATRGFLVENGYKGGDIYVFPLGGQNATVRREIAKLYRHARGTMPLNQTVYATDAFNSTARQVGTSISVATAQGWVDAAADNGEWLNLTFHQLRDPTETAEDWTPTQFQQIIDYLATADVDIVPTSEVLDSVRAHQPSPPFVALTQTEYDALTYTDPSVLYVIIP